MSASTSYRIKQCRLCGGGELKLVLSLQPTPVADAYVRQDQLDIEQPLFPLDLAMCMDCRHVQLLDVVDPTLLFGNYTYESSVSLGLVNHFKDAVADITARFPPSDDPLVVEIGSNDGSMLRFFKEQGYRVLGIDPARAIAAKATAAGIETWPDFFSKGLAEKIRREKGAASLVTANNVFAHSDQLRDMCAGIRAMLRPDGVFVFEVAYVADLIDRKLFDTVYHEHLCYHAVKPLQSFFARFGMELIEVERIGSKGGSLRGMAQRADGPHPRSPSVQAFLDLEAQRRVNEPQTYEVFAGQVAKMKTDMRTLVKKLKSEGRKLAGYGASATVTTLLYHFELMDHLDFIVDDNRIKHGLFVPGCHIPVHPSAELLRQRPDYVVILAWQYAEPILRNNQAYLAQGGKFIVPAPEIRIISAETKP